METQEQSLVDISQKLFYPDVLFALIRSYFQNHIPEHFDIMDVHMGFVEDKLMQLAILTKEKKDADFVFSYREENFIEINEEQPFIKSMREKQINLQPKIDNLIIEIQDYLDKNKLSLK